MAATTTQTAGASTSSRRIRNTAEGHEPFGIDAARREPAPPAGDSRMNRIARRAHELYEARGGQHGKALDDWLQAEREIDAEAEQPAGPSN
jgi:hypothetical protein